MNSSENVCGNFRRHIYKNLIEMLILGELIKTSDGNPAFLKQLLQTFLQAILLDGFQQELLEKVLRKLLESLKEIFNEFF